MSPRLNGPIDARRRGELDADRWERAGFLVGAGGAVVAVLLAVVSTPANDALLCGFLLLVIVSAHFGGLAGGFLVTVVGAALAAYGLYSPVGSIAIANPEARRIWVGFVAAGTIVSASSELLRRALRAAERRAAEAAEARREAEGEREQLSALLTSVLEASPVGHAFVDTELRYRHINPALAEMNGLPVQAHLGRRIGEVLPQMADVVEPICRAVLETGRAAQDETIEGETQARPGRQRSWLASYYPVTSGTGEILGVGIMALETTERVLLERKMLQLQRLQTVGRLAGGVAHDFNNLLTVVLGQAALLEERLAEAGMAQHELVDIQAAAQRGATLTRQLLAFARQQALRPQRLDLNELVRRAEGMIRPLIGEDVELVVRLGPGVRPVEADPGQIEQVLLNLVVNARDAMPAGGRLIIETANLRPPEADDEELAGERVALSVTDSGTGIAPEILSHVFEPFFTTKPHGRGSGLGLATSYGIVRQSGGRIEVRSTVGEGSTFQVVLPVMEGEGGAVAAAGRERVRGGAETILVVEDDIHVRPVATAILRALGYTVLEAGHGLEALALLEAYERPIDLLLTDLVMPHMGGKELSERLAVLHPETRIAAVSGYPGGRTAPSEAEGAEFLAKPYTAESLGLFVRRALDR